jgi:NAD(P)H-hydrate epimerase
MARLLGRDGGVVGERERLQVAQESAARWQHVVVLKGAFTVIAAPDGRCAMLPFANPLLGSAGSGDVLAGVIVSLLGQGLAAYEAAVLGAYLHGVAGELAREALGDSGLLSAELADWVAEAREILRP